ncbi:lipopolysaccharide biosynthesis protein [Pontibacter lucknowensis]|uniref:Membrane protein involved in the export of O-antigen and teichoic acid n=1 Tax=Pontibacter lucknowensis TaxID=1077936 RepID=A0A1N6ZFC6_9BACT|nr:lipopolysaccharide biosynthesis protein [Pontibacter lucknowensis]SIR25477.1 Membrane protein involved in the export of O-antigen and teichoic acid [Pontibacter lucknowensis]
MSKNLASKAVSGLKWSSAGTIANAVMQIGYTSAMARLLAPEAFGLVALSAVILRFGYYFANLGLNQAIIQKEELTTENIRAAFTSSALLGAVFTVLAWALAPYATLIFDMPEVVPIVRVMALAFVVGGVSATATSLLQRNMRFKALSIVETGSYVVSYLGVGILLAWLDFGVWSLVYASLVQQALVALGAYVMARHNVLPVVRWEAYRALLAYGSKMSVISFFEFIYTELATLLIGRVFGAYRLGIYNRAFMLVNLPMYNLTRTVSRVVFPSFSKLQSETDKLAKVYLSSTTLLATLIIPVCLGIMIAAPEIVYVVLGDQWGEAIPVLQVLSLAIPLSFITMFAGIVCDAKAVLNWKIVITITLIIVISGLFFLLKDYGLVGFGFALLISELIRIGMYQTLMKKILYLSYWKQLRVYLPGLLNGAVVAVVVYLMSTLLRGMELPHLVILLAQMITGAFVFLAMILLFPHSALKEQLHMIFSKLGVQDNPTSYYGRMLMRYRKSLVKETEHV